MSNNISKTIKECKGLPDRTIIPQVRAEIVAVNKYQTSKPGEVPPWTKQEIFIEDGSDSITVRIGNQSEITPEMVGKTVAFIASRKANSGQLVGVRMGTMEVNGEAGQQSARVLEITKSGQIVAVMPEPATAPEPVDEIPMGKEESTPTETNPPEVEKILKQLTTPPPTQKAAAPGLGFRIVEVRYDRTVNTGNYCNAKVGVTAQVDPGTKASDVLDTLKKFVEANLPKEVRG